MKAVFQSRYGSPDDLRVREVEMPAVGEDDVRVRVRAASVHPDVWHVVSGRPYVLRLMGAGISRPKNPIPGTDVAGVVESMGKRVTRFGPGDEVFGETIAEQQWVNGGAYAEYVSVPQGLLARKPGNITFGQAASVPVSGYIALQNLRDKKRLGPGQNVLINGAGGGVGTLALQIAKAHGAHVTAVDGAPKLGFLRSLGADETLDYRIDDFTRHRSCFDFIFDIPGDRPFSAIRRALRPGGRYVLIGHEHYGASRKRVFGLIPHFVKLMVLSRFVEQLRGPGTPIPSKGEAIEVLRGHLEAGEITPLVDSVYPFGEVREAFRHLIEDETHGKVILSPAPV